MEVSSNMCALARPSAKTLVIDLTQRLAEEYAAVPLTEVSRVVKRAAAAELKVIDSTPADELSSALAAIEQRSRLALRRRTTAPPAAGQRSGSSRSRPK